MNDRRVAADRPYVLYWMIAARRTRWNYALDRAIEWAQSLKKPLVVLEALRVNYPWASDRLHRFAIDGMADNRASFAAVPIHYYPYVEATIDDGKGLLAAIGRSACIVVTDQFPCFFLPRMVEAAAQRVDVSLEAIDGNGLLPLAAADRAYTAASHFRRFVQRELIGQLRAPPAARPLEGLDLPRLERLPDEITRRWPAATGRLLKDRAALAALPIDHAVPAVELRGGEREAVRRLDAFVRERLDRYADRHNDPDADITSRLSPYLHFGHMSAHEVFDAVMRHERWSLARVLAKPAHGAREGWWGVSASAEAFLDQLVVWRELAYNTCAKRPHDYDRYESLPAWALATLSAHRTDRRPYRYTRDEFESAATHDALWNAIQTQLRREGWFHNYMRMLWGKKILEWSRTPRAALDTMVHIMNRWSLDGRDPNAYAGYFWTLGRYDRPWPERPVFGTVRSMSSERTRQKVDVANYLTRFGSPGARGKLPFEP
jgi:deoxyribodipyrimidine photo-lyase